jgi:hypothetical protein
MAIVTSPENHAARSLPGDLAPARARRGADRRAGARAGAEGKAVVWIDGGLHATEVLGAQQLIETGLPARQPHDAETLRFLDDVIILAVHANPDGMELVSNWYMREPDPIREALDRRHPAAVPEVRRPRQQPRLLHVGAAESDEHEPRALPRVVPADHVQPPPDRPGRHGDVRAAVPRSRSTTTSTRSSRRSSTWSARPCTAASPPRASRA